MGQNWFSIETNGKSYIPQEDVIVFHLLQSRPVLFARSAIALEPVSAEQRALSLAQAARQEVRPVVLGDHLAG